MDAPGDHLHLDCVVVSLLLWTWFLALVGDWDEGKVRRTQLMTSFLRPHAQESEGEDAEAARVTLAQDMGRGNVASRQSRVRLYELGPRMELEIIKVCVLFLRGGGRSG